MGARLSFLKERRVELLVLFRFEEDMI
jgi:hypothetical protein